MDARQEEEGWRGEAGSGLPAEIIGEIIGWLTEIRSVAQCMAVCRAWHDLVRSQGRLWESLAGSRRLGIDPGFVPDHCDDWFQWIRARVKWHWDLEMRTPNAMISKDGVTITRNGNQRIVEETAIADPSLDYCDYAAALGDVTWSSGRHCWQVAIAGEKSFWSALGIIERDYAFALNQYDGFARYVMASDWQYYPDPYWRESVIHFRGDFQASGWQDHGRPTTASSQPPLADWETPPSFKLAVHPGRFNVGQVVSITLDLDEHWASLSVDGQQMMYFGSLPEVSYSPFALVSDNANKFTIVGWNQDRGTSTTRPIATFAYPVPRSSMMPGSLAIIRSG